MTDKEIIKNLKQDNRFLLEEAFDEMFQKYNGLLMYVSLKIVGNTMDATDVVSDVFLSVFKIRHDLLEDRNLKYYLITTTKNKSINFNLKKQKIKINKDVDVFELGENAESSPITSYFDELKLYLTEEEIDILLLHIMFDETFDSIAKKKNCSKFSIAGKYRRSVKKLRQHIRKED